MPLDFTKVNPDELTDQSEIDFLDTLEDEKPPDLTIGRTLGGFWQELKQWTSVQATSERSFAERDIRQAEEDPTTALWSRYAQLSRTERAKVLSKVMQPVEVMPDEFSGIEQPPVAETETLRQALISVYKERRETARATEEDPRFQMSPEFKDQSSGLIETVARVIGGSLPDTALTMLNPVIGARSMYKHIQGITFKELEGKGVEFDRAFTASNISAAVQTPLELLGSFVQIKGMIGSGAFRQHIVDLAESIGGEALTEFAQEYPDQLAMFWGMNPDLSADEMGRELVGKALSKETLFQALEAGAIGGLAGGVTTGGGKAVIGTVEKLVTPRQKEINRAKIERLGYLIDQVDNNTATDAHKAEIGAILGIGEQPDVQKIVEAVKSRIEFQEPVKGPGRDEVLNGLKSVKDVITGAPKFSEDQVSAQMALWDGVARSWAERNEKEPADFYEEKLIGFRQSAAAEVEAKAAQYQNAEAMQPVDVKSPEFKRWFKESAVTENDKPLMVYHGTTAPEDFDQFAVGENVATEEDEFYRAGSGGDPRTFLGSHFAKEKSVASSFAKGLYGERAGAGGGRVLPVYLSIKNPYKTSDSTMMDEMLKESYNAASIESQIDSMVEDADEGYERYDSDEEFRKEVNQEALLNEHTEDEPIFELAQEMASKYRSKLEQQGYDGIVYENEIEGGTSYVAFYPTQIKSALSNTGAFSSTDPRIQYQGSTMPTDPETEPGDITTPKASEGSKGGIRLYHGTWRPIDYIKDVKGGFFATTDKDFASEYTNLRASQKKLIKTKAKSEEGLLKAFEKIHGKNKKVYEVSIDLKNPLDLRGILSIPPSHLSNELFNLFKTSKEKYIKAAKNAYGPDVRIEDIADVARSINTEVLWHGGRMSIAQYLGEMNHEGVTPRIKKFIEDLGYDGVIFDDVVKENEFGTDIRKATTYVAFNKDQIRILPDPSRQAGEPGKDTTSTQFQDKRGAIEFLSESGQAIIHAFEAADVSTPIHETGHLIMQMMYDEGLDDYLAAAKWAGVDDARARSGYNQWTTEEKEKIARGFEAYVMEGRAPTMRLQKVFKKMKAWLMDIYRSVRRLDVKLTPEIRQVFDNMLTVEMERNEAPIPYDVNEWLNIDDLEKEIQIDDMESLADLNAEASRRVARAMADKRKKEMDKVKIALHKEAEKSVEANPIYEMLKEVRESGGFDKNELDFLYSADYVNDLIHRMPGLIAYSGKAKPDVVATRWGYYDTDELINAVMDSKTKEQAIEDYFQSLWDEYLIGLEYDSVNEYGKVIDEEIKILNSMLLTEKPSPQALTTRAIFKGFEKIINAADQMTTAELQKIHEQMKTEEDARVQKVWDKYFQIKERLLGEIKQLEETAAAQLEDQKFDYLIKLDKAKRAKEIAKIRAELAEQKQAEVKREKIGKLREKAADRIIEVKSAQKARMTEIRKKAKEQHEKRQIHGRMKRHIRTNPDPSKPTIAIEYKAQVVALLKTYNYSVPKKFDQVAPMNAVDFIQQIEQTDPYGAQALSDQMAELPPVKSKGMLTLEELEEVARTADMLMHFGREEQSRRTGEARAQHDDTINKMVEPIINTWGGIPAAAERAIPTDLKMNRWKKLQQLKGKYSAELQKAEFILRALDGFKDMGPNWELYGKISRAFDQELELGAHFAGKLKTVFESRGFDKKWAGQKYNIGFPELWTKEKLFMIALNSGNAQNLRYVKEGYSLTDDQVNNILNNILTGQEMDAVKEIWKVLEEMYPMLNAVHQKLTGVTLPKVEGNYFPLKWDRELSRTAAVFADKAVMQDLFASSAYFKANVAAPHRIARKRGGRRPQPLLSFSVLNEHLSKTVHDITHQVPVKEVQRLIHDIRFQKVAENALGTDVYDQLPKWLNYVARPQNEPAGAIEKFIGRLRRNTTIVGMGLKLSVALVQPSSYTITIDELGLIPSLTALKQFYTSPRETVEFIKERSPTLRFHDQVWDRELRQFYGKFDPTQFGFSNWMKDSYFWLISMMDKSVRYPTWLAGYNIGMEKFSGDDAKAIEYADTVTRRTQGTAAPQDLAEVQRGGELKRMMTMFYTFFSLFQNRMTELSRRRKVGDINMLQAFKSYWWILIFPAIVEGIIRRRSIDDPKEMLKDVISFRLAGLPFIRDIVNPIITGYEYSLTPVESAAEAPIRLAKSLQAEDVEPEKVAKHTLSTAGYIWGLPAGQMNIFIEGMIDLSDDETDNPMRLFFREPRKKKQIFRR